VESGKRFVNGPISDKQTVMSKKETSSDDGTPRDDDSTEILATDPDPVQIADTIDESMVEARTADESDTESDIESDIESEPAPVEDPEPPAQTPSSPSSAARAGRPWFGLFNLLLILALAGAAGYYWRQQQQLQAENEAAYQADIAELQRQLADKASNSRLQSSLSPFKGEITGLDRKLGELELGQQGLRESSEKLYQLFGRDKNDWQLAEVEYLMRVAQHKLILQNDFEGAAITLQAASDLIGFTADPGLLPVRVMISEEIADLKTRKRPDLVGMTLMLAQLGRQVRVLHPGFAVRVDEPETPVAEEALAADDWLGRFNAFLDSLVEIRKEATRPSEIEANIIDVAEALEDNLKLARWAVLERDASQYRLLLDRSISLTREFYDLDNAANHDFMTQLQDLQKMVINPDKPDITGSLRELQRILSQRENAPQPVATPVPESGNG
jgi:uroporphyrin-3 C-methyltransferase